MVKSETNKQNPGDSQRNLSSFQTRNYGFPRLRSHRPGSTLTRVILSQFLLQVVAKVAAGGEPEQVTVHQEGGSWCTIL